jgi:serine/threonine-protein kinase
LKRCPSCSFENKNDAAYCIQCGVALANITADDSGLTPPRPGYLTPGTVVDGKYRIERVLGEGGMGVVYIAHDVHTDMQVVVKAIRSEHAHNPEFRTRTLAEGRALARIDHPNVVRLNAVVVDAAALYLVMQFIDGEPLDALIERHIAAHSVVPVPLALSIFRMVLRGVGAAHAEGLIHRDLKPANILVRKKDGVAKVTDFGIAKVEDDAKAGRGVTKGIIGSVSYMAPEQVHGRRDLDKRVDIYALGIVLFELLIGRTPFEAPSDYEVMRMHAEAPLPSVVALRPDVPSQVDAAIQRACAKDRDHRFANTDEFLAALDAPAPPRTVPFTAQDRTVMGSGTVPGSSPLPMLGAGAFARAYDGPRGATDEGSALPSAPAPAARRSSPLVPLGIAGALIGAAVVIYFVAVQDEDGRGAARTSSSAAGPAATATPPATTMPTTTATATAAPVPAVDASGALAGLVGVWRSTSNRDYLAVANGPDNVEFRIQQASQHPRQGYEKGEVRFELKTIPGKSDQFAVEDHIRPTPPAGVDYDPSSSRDSCVGTWTNVKGRKLLANVDAKGNLLVDLVQIRTGLDKFKTEGKRVVGCIDLATAPAEPIESRLSRVR